MINLLLLPISFLAAVAFAFIKFALVLIGPIVVFVKMRTGRSMYRGWFYRISPERPYTWWEGAIRNPVGGINYWIKHPPEDKVIQYGHVDEPTPDGPRLQVRIRRYKLFFSIRTVIRYSRKYYGEDYFGWKLNSAPPELDFAMSPRLFAKVGN